jgi:hypothetical protein
MIKRAFLIAAIFLVVSLCVAADDDGQPSRTEIQHVATALDHITVLEFGEPVIQAATGSSAFNIEWRQNKVLIKPMKPGASTDLFGWTASRRFTYELDPPGEAKNMNYAVDNPIAVSKPVPTTNPDAQMAEIADMVLTRAFLGADRIDSSAIKDRRGSVVVRVEDVFRSANGIYVRYTIANFTSQPYRVQKPDISQLLPLHTRVSLLGLQNTQLDSDMTNKVRDAKRSPLSVVSSEVSKDDLAPGETARGVLVLRQQFSSPTVLELAFVNARDRHVTADFVF